MALNYFSVIHPAGNDIMQLLPYDPGRKCFRVVPTGNNITVSPSQSDLTLFGTGFIALNNEEWILDWEHHGELVWGPYFMVIGPLTNVFVQEYRFSPLVQGLNENRLAVSGIPRFRLTGELKIPLTPEARAILNGARGR